MVPRDPRIDAYLEKAPDFARPILRHLRSVVHAACPDATETIRWGVPHFDHRGILCGMAAFKAHCAFWFWKDRFVVPRGRAGNGMRKGRFRRLESIADLPPKATLARYVKKAVRLNAEGAGPVRRKPIPRAPLRVPKELREALARDDAARATFDRLPPSHRREYVDWIEEAKRADTRARRLATAMDWLAKGKARNWKYVGR